MKDCPVLLVAPPDPLAKLVDESVDVSRLLTGGPSLLVRFLSIYHLNIAPNVLCLVRNFFVEVWLELNEIGVWWCDWGGLEVVVEGVVGDVGGEDREGVLRGERAGIGGAGSGGVLCVLGGTRGRGRRGRVDGCDSPRLLTGGVEVGQGLGVVEPGVAQDGRGPPCPSPVSPAGRPVVRAGLLGVLVSPPRVGWVLIFLVVRPRYPKERPARLRPVHGQPCPPLPPGEGRVCRVSASWRAQTSSRAPGLPSVLEQIVDLAPGLGHPPGGAPLLSRRPPGRVGELEAHARQGA